jgi:hypothetical protein
MYGLTFFAKWPSEASGVVGATTNAEQVRTAIRTFTHLRPITALRRSPERPSFQSLSRFRQSHERPLKSLVVTAAQPIIPPPTHALRLLGKRFCYALTASQAHPDFSRRLYPSFARRFLLTCIGQAQASDS